MGQTALMMAILATVLLSYHTNESYRIANRLKRQDGDEALSIAGNETEAEEEDYSEEDKEYCKDAPMDSMRHLCLQMHRWDKNARAAPKASEKIVLPPSIPGQEAPSLAADIIAVPVTAYQCMDLGCLCQFMGGNGRPGSNDCQLQNNAPLRKSQRKEYRMMTDQERNRFHAVLNTLKQSREFDRIAQWHASASASGGAHSGPAFLPWHREYLKQFEIACRMIDPTVILPYWDSTLEQRLPNPADSILFSDAFVGTTDANGNVNGGPFANWRTFADGSILRRSLTQGKGDLLTDKIVQSLINTNRLEIMLGFFQATRQCPFYSLRWQTIEAYHGGPHVWVGGSMAAISTASNDPLFWMHHCFIDFIFEAWRKRQPADRRERMYPLDNAACSAPQHFVAARMLPFQPWQNIDGMNNKYTDNMFDYAPRPSCNQGANCGSPYLFCDRSNRELGPGCAAKVKVGGNCAGFTNNEDVCYNGQCQNGRCVARQAAMAADLAAPALAAATLEYITTTAHPIQTKCYNEHECCAKWAKEGQCEHNANYMDDYCKASCRKCTFNYNLTDDCTDRHHLCESLASQGMCESNQFWMAENCRKQCNKCQKSREEVCNGKTEGYTVTVKPPEQPEGVGCKSDPNQCFNEHICCQYWAMAGQCHTNATWMSCNCRVSCEDCMPKAYEYGTCTDYHPKCQEWAQDGQQCMENGWLLANCRKSCKMCINLDHLQQMCGGATPRSRRESETLRLTRDAQSETADLLAKDSSKLPPSKGQPSANPRIKREAAPQDTAKNAEVFASKNGNDLPPSGGMPK